MSGIDDILNDIDETTSQRTLAPVAVASQVGLMFGISVRLYFALGQTLGIQRGPGSAVRNYHCLQHSPAKKQGERTYIHI